MKKKLSLVFSEIGWRRENRKNRVIAKLFLFHAQAQLMYRLFYIELKIQNFLFEVFSNLDRHQTKYSVTFDLKLYCRTQEKLKILLTKFHTKLSDAH